MKKKTGIIISSVAITSLLAVGGIIFAITLNADKPFRLDDEYYATSEAITITKSDYEQLITNKKTFIVMIDKPGCTTTQAMREYMSNFPADMQFKYYRMMWQEVKNSSLHNFVKFTPSVAIINNGEVKVWLQADRDEDTEYFNSSEALQSWIRKYIEF